MNETARDGLAPSAPILREAVDEFVEVLRVWAARYPTKMTHERRVSEDPATVLAAWSPPNLLWSRSVRLASDSSTSVQRPPEPASLVSPAVRAGNGRPFPRQKSAAANEGGEPNSGPNEQVAMRSATRVRRLIHESSATTSQSLAARAPSSLERARARLLVARGSPRRVRAQPRRSTPQSCD
jgi:hypothetical protein